MEQQPKITALYCRFSKDDYREEDSSSIETQKTYLTQYAVEHGLSPFEFYVDDGYTGLNFDRPGFQRMIADIALGKIGTVITKDLSRLGRDHILTGQYSEIYFPTHRVRYIAITDQVDTMNQQSTYYSALKQAINEFYSRDTSVKIKAAFRAKSKAGQHLCNRPPYGYMKDPADKNHLIPDPETAPYVVKIFELCAQGWGNHQIRDYLRMQKVPIPSWYHHIRKQEDHTDRFADPEEKYIWRPDSLRWIIRNRVYVGDTVYGKSETIFKTKKHPKTDQSKWITVEGTHEALVSEELWLTAQQQVANKRRITDTTPKYGINLFNGILKCADCGKAMTRRKLGSKSSTMIYVCSSYTSYGVYRCSPHKIYEEDLIREVTNELRKMMKVAVKDPEKMVKMIVSKSKREENILDTTCAQYKKLSKRLEEVDRLLDRVYEDSVLGTISEDNFKRLMEKYQAEQKDLRSKMEHYEQVTQRLEENKSNAEKFVDTFRRHSDFEELTSELLNTLIEKIYVSEPEARDGVKCQKLHIVYRFVGELDEVDFNALNLYRSETYTAVSRKRAARQLKEREEETQKEIDAHPVIPFPAQT